jgi:YD repeat-containing protein
MLTLAASFRQRACALFRTPRSSSQRLPINSMIDRSCHLIVLTLVFVTRRQFLKSLIAAVGCAAVLVAAPTPVSARYYYASLVNASGGDCVSVAKKQFEFVYGVPASGYQGPVFYPNGGCSIRHNGLADYNGYADPYCDDDPGSGQVGGKCVRASPGDSCGQGNPIMPLAASKHEYVLDFTTGGPNPLKLERYYGRLGGGLNTLGSFSRLGVDWRTNFDAIFVTTDAAQNVMITTPDGNDHIFTFESPIYVEKEFYVTTFSTTKFTRPGVRSKLVKNGVNFELTTTDDTLWTFDATYRLTQIKFRGGYTQTLTYDTAGNNTVVTDSFGRTLTFQYDTYKRATQVTLPDSSVRSFTYALAVDPAVTPPTGGWPIALGYSVLSTTQQVGVAQTTTTYHYENASYPASLTGVTDARGLRYSTFGYSTVGRPISTQHTGGLDNFSIAYDDPNKKVVITNPLGKQTTLTYEISSTGRSRVISMKGEASANCPISEGTYAYDANNFVTTYTDEEGRVTKYVNDTRGQPTSITRGFGTPQAVSTTFTYHPTYRVPTQMVEPGLTTNYVWDAATGRLTSMSQVDTTTTTVPFSTNGQTRTTAYTYGTGGNLLTVDGPLAGIGDKTTYTYSTAGYIATVTNQVAHVTTINTVNGRGQPTQITDPNGIVTNLAYDVQGRLLTATVNPGASQAVTTMTYDAVGNITKITRPDNSWFSYTYDNARRLTTVTALDGQTATYTYDLMGNRLSTTLKNASAATTYSQTQTFDELGRLLK